MAALTQLRLPGESYSWCALGRVVDRPLGCSGCNRRIDPGTPHARGEEDGRRLCPRCVASAEVGETMTANEANRWQRQRKREHAERLGERMVRMLLDGLDVGSISELKRLVDRAREGVVLTPLQIQAIVSLFPNDTVRVRTGPGAPLEGATHVEVADATTYLERRGVLFSADVTRDGGNLGIKYDDLMSFPKGEPRGT